MYYNELISFINDKQNTNIEVFTKLSEYTYINYLGILGDVLKIFSTPINIIHDWKKYKFGIERSNKGLELEVVIINYLKSRGIKAEPIPNGRGRDMRIGDLEFEIKSSTKPIINTHLQTSFYKNNPKKFYIFISNAKKDDIEVRIVSSQLLYRISLGEQIFHPLSSGSYSEELEHQIDNGLKSINFKQSIKTSLAGSSSLDSKSFQIGNNINVRFLIYFEPSKH